MLTRLPEAMRLILGAIAALLLLLLGAVAASAASRRASRRDRADPLAAAASPIAIQSPATQTKEIHMAQGTFATAINCIDGRAQQPVADWVKLNCHADYVDVATIPGPDRALTHGHEERKGHIHEYVTISVTAHGSRVIAVAGHHDCAANPVSREEHIAAIREAVKVVSGWRFPAPVRVVGLWVNDWWQVEVVADTDKEHF